MHNNVPCDKENEDPMLPFAMNGVDINELSDNRTQKEAEVDVHLNYPSGLRIVHVNDTDSKYLIKNVALKNWKATVNIMFKHSECQPFIHEATRFKVKYSSPAEIGSFSNKLV